jgi:hypothetical protein
MLISIGFLGGCVSRPVKPTEVSGTTVTNSQFGFGEWTVVFPGNYQLYSPLKDAPVASSDAQTAWHMAQAFDKFTGRTSKEHIVFKSSYGAIAMTIASYDVGFFDRWAMDELVSSEAYGFRFPSGVENGRGVVKIGKRKVARITRQFYKDSTYNSVYIVPYMPHYYLAFNGYGSVMDKAAIDKDIESAISSFSAK